MSICDEYMEGDWSGTISIVKEYNQTLLHNFYKIYIFCINVYSIGIIFGVRLCHNRTSPLILLSFEVLIFYIPNIKLIW